MIDDAPPLDAYPHELFAERRAGSGAPLVDAARGLAAAISQVLAIGPLEWDVEASPPRKVTADSFEALLARLANGRPFAIADHPDNWTTLLAIQSSPLAQREYINVSLPPRALPQLGNVDRMIELVTRCALELGAHVAFTRDAAIDDASYGRRAHERGRAQIPAELRSLMPMEEYEPHPAVAGELPQLLVPQELPTERVPTGVYWINWWGPAIVAELGRERIKAADWARVEEGTDASMTLVATATPPDLANQADVQRLASIIDALELPALQHRLRR